jgi:transcriptional regulator with XRE-family HTH domain
MRREEKPSGQPGGNPIRQAGTEDALEREVHRLFAEIGSAVCTERRRRALTLSGLAEMAGLDASTVHHVESGRPARLETQVRIARALRMRFEVDVVDPRKRDRGPARLEDRVHAAMGEAQAARLLSLGLSVGMDEPFQHYHFAGRADVVAWSAERRALLHIENRTRFPNPQEAFGSFNAKREYLGSELARRAGVASWRSETHVMAVLWSGEGLHAIRIHRASFASICPDSGEAFRQWWSGEPPCAGRQSVLVVFDPIEGRRSDRQRWVGLGDTDGIRPRCRDYADALERLRAAGRA